MPPHVFRRHELPLLIFVFIVVAAISTDLLGEVGWVAEPDLPVAELLSLSFVFLAVIVWRRQSRKSQDLEARLQDKVAALAESQARYKDFAEAGAHYLWEMGADGRFKYVSHSIEKVTGDKPEEVINRVPSTIDARDVFLQVWTEELAGHLTRQRPFEEHLMTRLAQDGRTIHLRVSGRPFYDDQGRFLGLRCVSRDVTPEIKSRRQLADAHIALLRANKAAEVNEQRFRDFTEVSSDVTWEMDSDLKVTFISDTIESLTGDPPSAYVGRTQDEVPEAQNRSGLREQLEQRQSFRDVPFVRRTRDGRTIHLLLSAKAIFDGAGRFLGYRGTTRDVTAQRQAEIEFECMRHDRDIAQAADIAKTRFMASVSHELRTPLNAILGFSEIIKAQILGPVGIPRYADYAADIHSSGSHLLAIISDILDMSRIEVGRYTISPEAMNVSALIDESIAMVRGLADGAQLSLKCTDIPPALDVLVDRRATKQVLINLLSNSIKFTEPNGRILITAGNSPDGSVWIRVKDTGRGIDDERAKSLFQPFQNIDADVARQGGGSGLGLSISRSLMRLHGGDLEIESELGVGTTAKLTIPPDLVLSDRESGRAA